jgi:hypothetical protein
LLIVDTKGVLPVVQLELLRKRPIMEIQPGTFFPGASPSLFQQRTQPSI